MLDTADFPAVPHDPTGECCGCIILHEAGEDLELVCNECGAVVGKVNAVILQDLVSLIPDEPSKMEAAQSGAEDTARLMEMAYAEIVEHNDDYHHRTGPEKLQALRKGIVRARKMARIDDVHGGKGPNLRRVVRRFRRHPAVHRGSAESVYEAAALAVSEFRRHTWVDDLEPGALTPLSISIKPPATTHEVSVKQLEKWTAQTSRSPRLTALKSRVIELLGGLLI
jgi:hypothetical protein